VLFLPGTNNEPINHTIVARTAAYAGYRTIVLSYDNRVNPVTACGSAEYGEYCRGELYTEVLIGDVFDTLPHADVASEDTVVTRLYRLLEDLDANDPAGGWSKYYVPNAGPTIFPGDIVWENIILSGFSQGGSLSAYISRHFRVHGLFLIDAGKNDTAIDPATGDRIPAEWITETVATDASAGRPKYGMAHGGGDPLFEVPEPWDALGISSSVTLLDDMSTDVISEPFGPYRGAFTNQLEADPVNPVPSFSCTGHRSMARDRCMPKGKDSQDEAFDPPDFRLFPHYLKRFCYACDSATCP
jgi:hypothetical protein